MLRVPGPIIAMVGLAAAVPAAEAAEVHRFRVDLVMRQSVEWHQSYRDGEWCGQDHHRELAGTGGGALTGTLTRGRVAFTMRRDPVVGTHAVSSRIRFAATRAADAGWTGRWEGTPEGCPPDLPDPDEGWFDTSDCGPTRAGRVLAQLNVVRGRMWLSGNYDPPGSDILCMDPTDITTDVGAAGASARRNVVRLLRSEQRTIRLGAADRVRRLAAKELAFLPSGFGNVLRAAGGEADVMWRARLTRLQR